MQTRSLPCDWPGVGSPGSRATSFHTCQVLRPRRVLQALALNAPVCIAFRLRNGVSTRNMNLCGAQWLAYVLLCRRFAVALTGDRARLGVDVDRYSFIVSDLHRLLVAGLPARCERFWTLPATLGPLARFLGPLRGFGFDFAGNNPLQHLARVFVVGVEALGLVGLRFAQELDQRLDHNDQLAQIGHAGAGKHRAPIGPGVDRVDQRLRLLLTSSISGQDAQITARRASPCLHGTLFAFRLAVELPNDGKAERRLHYQDEDHELTRFIFRSCIWSQGNTVGSLSRM